MYNILLFKKCKEEYESESNYSDETDSDDSDEDEDCKEDMKDKVKRLEKTVHFLQRKLKYYESV